jgi:hypothetical protein
MDEGQRHERHFLIMIALMLLFFGVSIMFEVANANGWTATPLDGAIPKQVFHDFFIVALVVFQQASKAMQWRTAPKEPGPQGPRGPLGPRLVERLAQAESTEEDK